MNNDIDNYCIVGFGNHSKTKILPALQKLNKNIFGIVTSKSQLDIGYQVFSTLEEAIEKSHKYTKFIICSPPKEHFSQIKLILESCRSIYVEKPIFTNVKEANEIKIRLKNKDIFIVELLMYKYNNQYYKFLKTWNKTKHKIIQVKCVFNIPSIPSNTFRDANDIESSPLYDIGCYIISLLVDLKIYLDNLKIKNIEFKNKKIMQFYIEGHSKKIKLNLEFGVGNPYKNSVKLNFINNRSIEFNKFFYGREENKTIIFRSNKRFKKINFKDHNGFEKLFQYPNSNWFNNQEIRFNNIIRVNKKLSTLTKELILFNSR